MKLIKTEFGWRKETKLERLMNSQLFIGVMAGIATCLFIAIVYR